MMPNTITFQTTNNPWVMRITADRRIEVNEDVEVTEAAKKVLDAMQHLLTPQRTWVGLTNGEVNKIIDAEIGFNSCWGPEKSFARAIEAKLKEKNYYD
jgi:hypothetical protein